VRVCVRVEGGFGVTERATGWVDAPSKGAALLSVCTVQVWEGLVIRLRTLNLNQ